MKLTKSHLKQIIKEEVQGFGQGERGKDNFSKKKEVYMEAEGDINTLMSLQKKLRGLYQTVGQTKGLDPAEITLFDKLIELAIARMEGGNAKTPLMMALQKLQTGQKEAPAAPAASPAPKPAA